QTVMVRTLPPAEAGTTILPPFRMWSDWSRTNVPLLFPTLLEIWHSAPTTTPPRSVHPSANAARAGRKMNNAATMTRGIDNRLMVQGLSELRRVLCEPQFFVIPAFGNAKTVPLLLLFWSSMLFGPISHSLPPFPSAALVLKRLPVPDTLNPTAAPSLLWDLLLLNMLLLPVI